MPSFRYWFSLFVLLCAIGALAQTTNKRSEVIVWGVSLDPDSKGMDAVIREFERRHPEIRIRVLSMGAGRMDPQKLMTSIVGNVPPDVINQDRFTIGDFASRGAFRPMDDLIQRDSGKDPLCPVQSDYYKPVWEEASYNGKVYAIPTGADNRVLYWNREMFQKKAAELRAAGLDPNRAPRTWSELLAYSKVLTEFNSNGQLKVAGFMPNYGNSWLYMYAFQTNAHFMSPDGKTCTLNSPEAVEALDFIVKGYDVVGGYETAKAYESGFQSGENDPFVLGKVPMKIDGDWILGNLVRYAPHLDFATAPAPVPDDRLARRGHYADETEPYITWAGGFSYAIPRGARNVNGGWEFIKFATSLEGRTIEMRAQRDWERHRGRAYIPRLAASISANELMFTEFRPADTKFAEALKTHIAMMTHARIRPVTFVGQTLWDEHVRAMENAALKKMSSEKALRTGQAVVQKALNEVLSKSSRPIADFSGLGFWVAGFVVAASLFLVWRFRSLRLGKLARHEAKWGYLLVGPWVLGFLVFTAGPMLASFVFSFTQYDVLSDPRWVGGKNYSDLFSADWGNIVKAFSNALYLGGIGVPLGLATGLTVALLLNAAAKGMRFYRTIFYTPAIVPGVASAVLWIWLLTSDPDRGLINAVWQATFSNWFGTPVPGWLNAEAWAKPALILMGTWGAGSGMILWLAGLKGVPTQLYEAAGIDGASDWKQFWTITLPQLSPIVFFNAVMGLIGALQEFDRVYIMRPPDGGAGPADSLLMPVFHLFVNGFGYFKMGYASALAWVIFALILMFTMVQFWLAPKWVHYEAER